MTSSQRDAATPRQSYRSDRAGGFSLIEFTIVIAVMGLLLGAMLTPLAVRVDTARYNEVGRELRELERALFGFAVLNARLPCADTSGDGLESVGCAAGDEGFIPWVTLGVSGTDAWGRRYRYRVDNSFTVSIPLPPDTVESLLVADLAGNPLTTTDPDAAVAVIFSCGKNGIPDAGNDDDGNPNASADCTNSAALADGVYTQDIVSANLYDDVLLWVSKNALVGHLVQATVWP